MGVKEASARYLGAGDTAPSGESLPSGYKRSEVGVIPEDWLALPFHRLFRRINGTNYQILAADYKAYGQLPVIDQGQDLVAGWTDRLEKRFGCPAGGVVVFGDHTRVVKYVSVDFAVGADGTQLLVGREPESTRFLAYQMQATEIPNAGYSRHFKFLAASFFAWPPSACERLGIVETLSDADALIESLKQLIAKKRALKQSAIQALLSNDERLPSFSGDWKRVSLKDVSTCHSGVWGSGHLTDRSTRRARVIRAGDISQDSVLTGFAVRYLTPDEYQKAKCELDDVVVTTSGNGLGKTWWVDGRRDLAASNFVRVIRPHADLLSGKFLSYVLRSETGLRQLAEHTATSAYPNLRPSFFSVNWVELPPLDEQLAIAKVLSDIDADISALETRLAKTSDLKAGMIQALLTGRIRLPLDQTA